MATLRISGGDITLPTGSIGNEQVKTPGSGEQGIAVTKLRHLHKPGTNFGKSISEAPVTREEVVFVALTAGVIRAVHALLWDTGTTGSVSFDVKVNGTSILSSTFSVSSADADRAIKDGTIASANFSANDVISISATLSGSDGTGPFAWLEIEEAA